MAAPTIFSNSLVADGAARTNPSYTLPASIAAGDIIVLAIGCGTTFTLTGPAGFTKITNFANTLQGEVWAKVAAGTEGGTVVSFTIGNSRAWTCEILVIRGSVSDVANVLVNSGATGSGTAPPSMAITTTVDDTLCFNVLRGTTVIDPVTVPSTWTLTDDGESVGATGANHLTVAQKVQATAGSTGTATWSTTASSIYVKHTLGFPPATGTTLSGQVDGTSSVDGQTTAPAALTGGADGASVVTGQATAGASLSGTVACTSAVTGQVAAGGSLAGTVAAASTVTGQVSTAVALSGSVASVSSVTGQVNASVRGSGTIASSSTVTGQLAATARFAGGSAGVATISGGLQGNVFSGTVASTSSVTGQVRAPTGLAGSLTPASTVTGQVRVPAALTGTAASTSTVTGQLAVLINLTGTVTATSTVTGQVAAAALLGGAVGGVSTIDGQISFVFVYRPIDTTAGTTVVTEARQPILLRP